MNERPDVCLAFAMAVAVLALAGSAFAASNTDTTQPTFYEHVLPIMQANCQTCHRPSGENIGGMIAPMALFTYDDVRPWAKSIAKKVASREMPPWFATEATRGQFHHERVMSEREIETLVAWTRQGAPAGDPAKAPPARKFVEEGSGGWSLGKPDLVVQMPQPHFVADEIADININFHATLSAEQLPEDAWVRGIEFRVGGNRVHHMCANQSAPGDHQALGKFGGNSLGCIALGAESQMFPEGYAMKLQKGATISFSMHYNKEPGPGSGFSDQSEIGFHFTTGPVREIKYDPIGNMTFEIPPGQPRWKVGAARVFPVETDLIALWPHGHHRAAGARYEAIYPDGRRELLLDVPQYDQNWQTTYQYKVPKTIPAGTRVEVTMWYENTPERGAERGFDAARGVINGTATTDEMMLGFINYATREPIDELSMRLGIAPRRPAGSGGR